MADIGDKSFTTQMVSAIETVVEQSIGNDALTNRFTAQVTAVDSINSTVSVMLPGASDAASGFTVNGIQMPVIGDYVIVYINESERWVDNVYRTATSSPYLSVTSGSLNAYGANNFGAPTGAVMGWLTATAPTGWLFCDGTSYAYNTYPALGALLGGSAGGNFTTPDMRDRFLGSLGTVGAWSNTTGLIGPNSTITNNREHTHNTDLAHGHSFSAGAHIHNVNVPSHTHTVNPPSTESGIASVGGVDASQFAYIASNATYRSHTHFTNIVTLDSGAHDESAFESGSANYSTAASVTSLGETLETSSAATYSGSNISPKATRLNFIIKT